MKRIRNYSISGSKYFILGVIFLVTVIITFISMKFEQIMPSATTMADATLPTVAMDTRQEHSIMCFMVTLRSWIQHCFMAILHLLQRTES